MSTDGAWGGQQSVFGVAIPDITRVATGEEVEIIERELLTVSFSFDLYTRLLLGNKAADPLLQAITAIEERLRKKWNDIPLARLYYQDQSCAKIKTGNESWIFGWSQDAIIEAWNIDGRQRRTADFITACR